MFKKEQKKVIKSVLGNTQANEQDIKKVIDTLHDTGAVDFVRKLASEKIEIGKKFLNSVNLTSEGEEFFNAFADFMISRKI